MYEKLHRARLGAALLGMLAIVAGVATVQAASKKMPTEWDGLLKQDSKGIDGLYVLPEASFTAYKQVMVDPVNVEFHKNWKKDMNDTIDISRKVDAVLNGSLSPAEAVHQLMEFEPGSEDDDMA
jgi:hypothetical protein